MWRTGRCADAPPPLDSKSRITGEPVMGPRDCAIRMSERAGRGYDHLRAGEFCEILLQLSRAVGRRVVTLGDGNVVKPWDLGLLGNAV